jgi:hypothetical protein
MEPLPNVRQEKFVQALFAGKSATEAYALAGYKPHQGNSSRLRWYEMVQSRLHELQGEAARSTKVTLESVCRELDEAISVARNKHQAQAMVSATSMKAKLNGLLTERIEIGAPGLTPNCEKELRRTADLLRFFANRIQTGEETQSVVADVNEQEKRIASVCPD